jgi:predicted AAA+ superfamily ATPase
LSYFEDSYLLESVAHLDFKGKSTLGNAKKFYCVDLGLASGARSFHPDATKIYENAVYLELIHRGFSVMVGRIVCDSTLTGKPQEKEIDFLADKGRQHYGIQVFLTALTATKFNKEVGNFEEGDFPGRKLCITEQKQFQPPREVTMMNLEDFLLKDTW